jgi:hypothetical protein
MRILNRYRGLAALLSLAAAGVFADSPAATSTVFPATGGNSVTGSGQWSVITNDTPVGGVNCPVQVYRQNYATMAWNLFDTIGSVLEETCVDGDFGDSSSLSGNVLVVGIPNYDSTSNFLTSCSPSLANRGAFSIYEWNGAADWPRINVGNCALNQIRVDTANQAGANYGYSVSVSRQGTTNDYIIAVGSPNFDAGGGGADRGKVDFFRYNAATDNLTLATSTQGLAGGDQLGYAVTVSGTYILIGAPGRGTGGVNDSPGAAYLFELLANNTVTLRQTIAVTGSNSLGREVSLSQQIALISSDTNAYSYQNTAVPWNFTAAGGPFVSGGGDVSQDNGIAAIGVNNPATYQGHSYRNVLTDTPLTDAVIANPGVDYGLADPSLVGDDIRLTRESLWFADPGNERALLYQYPAGLGARMTVPYGFAQRSIPCNAEGKTVGEVFGYLGVNNTDFVVYLFDETKRTNAQPYKKLADSYVFTAADAKYSIFIAVRVPQYVSVDSCTGFTVPTVVGSAVTSGSVPFVDTIAAQRYLALPSYVDEAGSRLMVNNPFPRTVRAADIRFIHLPAASSELTLQAADAANYLAQTLYVYDPNSTIPTGQNYRAITPNGTPPFQDRIQGYEGFWVRLKAAATSNPVLIMPQPE